MVGSGQISLGDKASQQYCMLWKEPILITQIIGEIANMMHEFTQSGGVRHFEISLLVVVYDDESSLVESECCSRSLSSLGNSSQSLPDLKA